METTLKAIAIQTFGGPEGLAMTDLPHPSPAEGQVLISIEAIGVGFVDAMIRSGALAAFGFKEGYVPGNEIAGTVTAVGAGVDPSLVGQRVWAFTGGGGGYAEAAAVSANVLVPLPGNVPAVDAVTIGSCGIVAHFGLRHAHLSAGETVLIRGAAGGIGIMAIQFAARAGASVIAVTASSAERGERLRQLGATHVLDRAGQGDADAPATFDVIIDIVGGDDIGAYFARLNPNGRMVAVGAIKGFPPADFAAAMYPAFQKSLSFGTFSGATVPEAERRAFVADLLAAAGRGEVKAVVQEIVPLEDAVRAHQMMDAGIFGRMVMTTGKP